MKVPPNIEQLLAESKKALADNSEGHLRLPYRRRIWRAYGPVRVENSRAVISEGLMRRANLARLCAEHVLPIWREGFPEDDRPQWMLDAVRQYLTGRLSFDVAYDAKSNFWGKLEGLMCEGKRFNSIYAGFAAVNAITTALKDEYFGLPQNEETELDDDLDPYGWDASFLSSLAFAGGAAWEPQSSVGKRREFWQWYLKEAVPKSLEI